MVTLGEFLGLLAFLYYTCIVLFAGLIIFIAASESRIPQDRVQVRRAFFLLSIALLVWQITLFLEPRVSLADAQLWLGRVNFAAISAAVYFALRFVHLIPMTAGNAPGESSCLVAETSAVTTIALLTPLVDAAERVESGIAISSYGVLFPVYLLHVIGFLLAAIVFAFRERRRTEDPLVRGQLTLLSVGMMSTGGIAIITNVILPYAFRDFRFCDIGTLSTLLFVLAVAYAMFIHRLFDLLYIVRETLVYGVLLAFVLGAYSSGVFVVSQYLTDNTGKVTQFVVLLIAFTFDPLRRFLEERTDRLLFDGRANSGSQRDKRKRDGGKLRTLSLLFPWRRQ